MIERIESDLHKEAVTAREETHAADLEISWNCTLLEFFYGSTKLISFHRQITQGDGATMQSVSVEKEIEIKPGMNPGTVLRFVGEGNQPNDKLPGDLIVTI
mmetsp:Transcript_47350/g.62654  ORF Transcript_47350/g.62654 Transcript_47350/m.62654 type:complete len:101 (-) Transcript_47350:451-753(-)